MSLKEAEEKKSNEIKITEMRPIFHMAVISLLFISFL